MNMDENDSSENTNEGNTSEDKLLKQSEERQEYMMKLQKWLDDARLWHYNICARIPTNSIPTSNANIMDNILRQYSTLQTNLLHQHFQNLLLNSYSNNFNRNAQNSFNANNQIRQPPTTCEFVVPPLWKRAIAELMDFLLLFLLKMALTFVILESFDIIDMGTHGFESFQKNLENSEVAMPIAVELLTLEVLHRIIVCAYETYFLRGKLCATPGKRYMGLIVVTAEAIAPGRLPDTVTATRATPLNWQKSFMRAALKNLFIGIFMPICAAFYIFPYNRTSYDMLSNSIVVEYQQDFMLFYSAL